MNRFALTAAVALVFSGVLAAQTYIPRRTAGILLGDRFNNRINYLKDSNFDGDFADTGEIVPWYTGINGILPTTIQDLAIGSDGTVYLSDSGTDSIITLVDGDSGVFPPIVPNGNADDPGEAKIYFDASSALGFVAAGPQGICVTQGTFADVIWIANNGNGLIANDRVIRCEDLNGDGDAQDVGEAVIWYEKSTSILNGGPDLDNPNTLIVDPVGQLLVCHGSANGAVRGVYRLLDAGGTPGANDAGEVNLYFPLPNGTAAFAFTMQASRNGDVFVMDRGTPDVLYTLRDLNGDGDAMDAGESTVFWQPSALVPGTGSLVDNLVEYIEWDGSIVTLLAEDQTPDRVLRLQDLNVSGTIDLTIEQTTMVDDLSIPIVPDIGQPKAIEALTGPFLDGPSTVVPGQNVLFSLTSTKAHAFVLAYDVLSFPSPFPPYGLFQLSPFAQVFIASDFIPPTGTYFINVPTPAIPTLSGFTVYMQAADFDGISGYLSNLYSITFL